MVLNCDTCGNEHEAKVRKDANICDTCSDAFKEYQRMVEEEELDHKRMMREENA